MAADIMKGHRMKRRSTIGFDLLRSTVFCVTDALLSIRSFMHNV
jgi:hypothetical protein